MKPGNLNVGHDHLSQMEIGLEPNNLKEGFPNVHLFAMRITDNHFTDTIRFLTMWMTPKGYTSQQKKELVVCTIDFLVIAGHMYKMDVDEIL